MGRITPTVRIQKRKHENFLENSFNGNLNIFHRSRPKAPDPFPVLGNGSATLIFYMQNWSLEPSLKL